MVWTLLANGRSPITMPGAEMEYSREPEVEKNTTNLEWGYNSIHKREWTVWLRWRNHERWKLDGSKQLQKKTQIRFRWKWRRILESRNTRITDSLIHNNYYRMICFRDILSAYWKAWPFIRQHWIHSVRCGREGPSSVCDVDRYVIIGNLHILLIFICQ
jgi:hypothetical protein